MRRIFRSSVALLLLAMLLTANGIVTGDSAPTPKASAPTTPPTLKLAKAKHDAAIKEADAAYRKAALAAKNAYLRAVQAAFGQAMKAGKLDDANAIRDIEKQLDREITELSPVDGDRSDSRLTFSGKVAGGKGWQVVRRVQLGDSLKITATGQWCSATSNRASWTSDADGNHRDALGDNAAPLPGVPFNALIGRIGEKIFLVGKSATIKVEEDGMLELRMNQPDGALEGADGEMSVVIVKQ